MGTSQIQRSSHCINVIPKEAVVPKRRSVDEVLFFHEVLETLSPDSKVLDGGCGSGSFSYHKFPHLKIKAVDIAVPDTLDNFPNNVEFLISSLSNLPFENNFFDFIIFNWVLEHVLSPEVVLSEAYRVLKDGGLLYASIPMGDSFQDRFYRFLLKGGGHIQRFTCESFMAMAYSAGFMLLSFCEWPTGYAWVKNLKFHKNVRGKWLVFFLEKLTGKEFNYLWIRVVYSIAKIFGKDLMAKGNMIFLFSKTDKVRFRYITHGCQNCGSGAFICSDFYKGKSGWECPSCGKINIFVPVGNKQKGFLPLVIQKVGLTAIKAGKDFKFNGQFALWAITKNATETTVIIWGEMQLYTTFGSPAHLTALVPNELYTKPGQYQIYLLDTKTGAKSNTVVITVEE